MGSLTTPRSGSTARMEWRQRPAGQFPFRGSEALSDDDEEPTWPDDRPGDRRRGCCLRDRNLARTLRSELTTPSAPLRSAKQAPAGRGTKVIGPPRASATAERHFGRSAPELERLFRQCADLGRVRVVAVRAISARLVGESARGRPDANRRPGVFGGCFGAKSRFAKS